MYLKNVIQRGGSVWTESVHKDIRGHKNTTDRRWEISFIYYVLLLLLSITLSSSLYYRSAYSSLSPSRREQKSAKVRVQVEIDWRLACIPSPTLPLLSLYMCVCCDCVCVVFLLAAGLTSCPMETHWLSFLFNGQSGQCSQQPDGTGLTVWPEPSGVTVCLGRENSSYY